MDIMSILLTVLLVALVGFLVHLITKHIPMAESFKEAISVIVVFFLVLWVIGILSGQVNAPAFPRFNR